MLKKQYNSIDLKEIGMVCMLIDHIGAVLIETTYLHNIEQFQMLDVCFRLIGRMAFPIFAFLLVEGFLHTSSWKKYAMRMFVLAIVSEVPFDLAAYGSVQMEHQNVFFTLLIGLCVLKGIEWLQTSHMNSMLQVIGVMAVSTVGAGMAYLGKTDYSWIGILLIVILYLFRQDHRKRCIYGGILFAYELTSIIAFVMLYRYNGEKGESKIPKFVWYIFYPVHLLLLWMIRMGVVG